MDRISEQYSNLLPINELAAPYEKEMKQVKQTSRLAERQLSWEVAMIAG